MGLIVHSHTPSPHLKRKSEAAQPHDLPHGKGLPINDIEEINLSFMVAQPIDWLSCAVPILEPVNLNLGYCLID